MAHIGVPYKWGGNNALEGFDCSGFVQEGLMSIGKDPKGDQTAYALLQGLRKKYPVLIDDGEIKRSDILFFGSKDYITHTAVSIGEGLMIEAGGGGSKTKDFKAAMKAGAMVRIRPIRRDLKKVVRVF